jgi:hypothetical protein
MLDKQADTEPVGIAAMVPWTLVVLGGEVYGADVYA